MPNFISDNGKWYPAKEKVGLENKSDASFEYDGKTIEPGEPFVYEGPDREALKELELQGLEFLGKDFRNDPEFLQGIRNMGFQDVEDYLSVVGYNEDKAKKDFKEKASKVKSHEIKERVQAIKVLAGGQAPNKEEAVVGGFGAEKLTPASKK